MNEESSRPKKEEDHPWSRAVSMQATWNRFYDLSAWLDAIEALADEKLADFDKFAEMALQNPEVNAEFGGTPFQREAMESRNIVRQLRDANLTREQANLVLGGILLGRNFARLQNKQSEALLSKNAAEKKRKALERWHVWKAYKEIRKDADLSEMQCYAKVLRKLNSDGVEIGDRMVREHIAAAKKIIKFAESLARR